MKIQTKHYRFITANAALLCVATGAFLIHQAARWIVTGLIMAGLSLAAGADEKPKQ